jgi:RNA polymerase sigma-70 factor, ECF subfamily
MITERSLERSAQCTRTSNGTLIASRPGQRSCDLPGDAPEGFDGVIGFRAEPAGAVHASGVRGREEGELLGMELGVLVSEVAADLECGRMTQSQMFERDALPHMEAVERFAYRLCHDPQWSRDLRQETMLKAFSHFDMFRPGTNCRAWLFRICRYSFINGYRRRKREPVLMDFDDEAPHQGLGDGVRYQHATRGLLADASYSNALSRAIGDEVLTALQLLPLVFQTAVILSDIEGHPYDEIAEFMHVPLGTVRSRLHRGRCMLAKSLSGYARDSGYSSSS